MQHGDKSHDDMTIEYRFRRHTIWFSMFMFAKDRVRVKKNRVSIFFFAIVPLSVVEMQKHAWFLVEPEVKQFNHRKNFLISKTLANLVIQFRNQFCAGASHKMLNWIWNTTRLIFSKMPMTSSCNQCIESWWEHFSPPTRKSAVVFNVEMIVVISRSEHDTFLRLISVKMYAKLSCQARHLNEIQLIKILLKPTS